MTRSRNKKEILRDDQGREICGALAKSTGKPCRQWRLYPNGRCHAHGGPTPDGPDSPHFKHGRYSKNLPAQLAARFNEVLQDRDILSLRDDVALVDVKINGLVTTLGKPVSWDEAQAAFERLQLAFCHEDDVRINESIDELDKLFNDLGHEKALWDDLFRCLDMRRRLVESESKRMANLNQFVPVEKVMIFINALQGILTKYVTDTATRSRIGREIRQLYDPGTSIKPEP